MLCALFHPQTQGAAQGVKITENKHKHRVRNALITQGSQNLEAVTAILKNVITIFLYELDML